MNENPFLEYVKELSLIPKRSEEKTSGFFGSLISIYDKAAELISGEYFFHLGNVPDIIKKKHLELHGLDLRTEIQIIIENNRIGNADSNVLISNDYFSLRSKSGIGTDAQEITLKIPLNWISRIDLHFDVIYFEFHAPEMATIELKFNVSSFCEKSIGWHFQKLPLFIKAFQKLVESKQNSPSVFYSYKYYLNESETFIKNEKYKEAITSLNVAKESVASMFLGVHNQNDDFLISESVSQKTDGGYFHVYGKYLPLNLFVSKSNPLLSVVKSAILECEKIQSQIDVLSGKSYESIYRISALKSNKEFESDKNLKIIYEDHVDFFKRHFTNIPLEKRKVLLYTKTIPGFIPNCSVIITPDLIPNVDFTPTHPRINQTYVCHPYRKNYYLPSDTYSDVLIDERVNELFSILRSLGAKRIRYISDIKSYQLEKSKQSTGVKVGVDIQNEININQEVNYKKENSIEEVSLSNSNYELVYSPDKKPFLPENLVWFPYEPEWNRIANDRIKGNLLSIKTHIKREKSDIVSSQEQLQINSEFKALNVPASYSVSVSKKTSEYQKEEHSTDILIEVDFADINELK